MYCSPFWSSAERNEAALGYLWLRNLDRAEEGPARFGLRAQMTACTIQLLCGKAGHRVLGRLNNLLLLMGIPGLLAVSFLDSAAIPLAGGPDAIIMLLSWKRPALTLVIVLTATIGSVLGCLVLYGIGKKGGEKALARFNPEKTAWVEKKMQRHGLLAIIAAVLAPPPFPTKLVILAAGVLRTGKWRLAVGAFIGRLMRFSLMGFLAARFGDRAAEILKHRYPTIALVLIGGILLVVLIRNLKGRAAV
jgi:undecaprenyl-diphosphatase